MISDVEENTALMIPEEDNFNENYDSYPKGYLAGQTAQDTGHNCDTWACLDEVAS